MPHLDLHVHLAHLTVQLIQVIAEALQQLAKYARQIVFAVFQDLGQTLGDVANALSNNDPLLRRQTANLIGQRGARLHKRLLRPVQRQHDQ